MQDQINKIISDRMTEEGKNRLAPILAQINQEVARIKLAETNVARLKSELNQAIADLTDMSNRLADATAAAGAKSATK